MSRNVAIVGATGAVGQELLSILEERHFKLDSLKLLASSRSAGRKVKFCGEDLTVEELTHESFKGVDIVFSSAGASISKEFLPSAVAAGAVCIDNTSYYRMDKDVPLVVPEVNPGDIKLYRKEFGGKGIIANPNCTTIMMVVVLNPIHKYLSPIRKIHVSSYQSASGAGASAMEELKQQYKDIVETGATTHVSKFPHQLAYNVIPQIDKMTENDYTKEEMKMFNETRKIMHAEVRTSATCVRVSSLRSHSESVWFETERPVSVKEIREVLGNPEKAPGVTLMDDPQNYVYPMPLESAGKDDVFVGRVRKDLADDNSNTLWLTGDQIRKGAALNAVQIGELL